MPNRIIKESALDSEDLSALSNGGERLFWRLIVVADDFGRFDGAPQVVKARCFPRLIDKLRTSEIEVWMKELEPKLVRFYVVNGRPYGCFLNWLKHQQQRAKVSKFPEPPPFDDICNHLQSKVSEIEIEIEKRDRDRDRLGKGSPRKTLFPENFEITTEMSLWASAHQIEIAEKELESFRDYHTAKGNRFIDWNAAFRTWLRNSKRFEANNGNRSQQTEGELSERTKRILRRGL